MTGDHMASPSVTYTFSNSTTADASQVNQNFTDLINGLTDGTKDLSISALTCAGNVSLNGNTTIGNASSDTFTLTASLASSIPLSAHNTHDIGSVTTLGLRAIYFASSSATKTAKLQGPAVSSDVTLTLPASTGTVALNGRTVQNFTSGSGTYTTPAGCIAIRVRMVGGGGSGSGGGTASWGAGNNGNDTTFGTALLTASAGAGGAAPASSGGAGGSYTINSPAIGFGVVGGAGFSGGANMAAAMGGAGGGSALGGAGAPTFGAGGAGATNSGAGGAGGYGGAGGGGYGGEGGGAGGFIDALIIGPSASYSYSVGAASTGGTAGTGGNAGGAGAAGRITVEEYY